MPRQELFRNLPLNFLFSKLILKSVLCKFYFFVSSLKKDFAACFRTQRLFQFSQALQLSCSFINTCSVLICLKPHYSPSLVSHKVRDVFRYNSPARLLHHDVMMTKLYFQTKEIQKSILTLKLELTHAFIHSM